MTNRPPGGEEPRQPQAPGPDMASVFEDFLNGDMQDSTVGLWRIVRERGAPLENLSMYYHDSAAIYGFKITEDDDLITVDNFHRNAQPGKGTPTLREIERNLALLATKRGKKVLIKFGKFGQEDTATWLTKNGYTYDSSNDSFTKEIG